MITSLPHSNLNSKYNNKQYNTVYSYFHVAYTHVITVGEGLYCSNMIFTHGTTQNLWNVISKMSVHSSSIFT